MKARILKGGWSYGNVACEVGAIIEAPPEQVGDWAAEGYAEPVADDEDETATESDDELETPEKPKTRRGRKA